MPNGSLASVSPLARNALPSVEGLLADSAGLADPNDRRIGFFGLAQYPDLLLSRVSLAFHGLGPFWIPRLTLSMAQFS